MNPIVRNILAVLAGIIIGGIINMGIITLSSSIIPVPEGVNTNDLNSIRDNIHLYQPKHFIMPILAHALGVLSGAYATVRIAASKHLSLALIIGAFFLIGGSMMVYYIPEQPIWVAASDLLLAYFPMAWLGWKIAPKE